MKGGGRRYVSIIMSGEKTYHAKHRNPLMQSDEAVIVFKATVTMESLIHGVG